MWIRNQYKQIVNILMLYLQNRSTIYVSRSPRITLQTDAKRNFALYYTSKPAQLRSLLSRIPCDNSNQLYS